MNLLRSLVSLKTLLVMAVAFGVLIPLGSTRAEAFGSCPCNFSSTLLYGKQTARTFDSKFDFCSIRDDNRLLLTTEEIIRAKATSAVDEIASCGLLFEVNEESPTGEDGGVCTAQMICTERAAAGQLRIAPSQGQSSLETRWNVDERTRRACERELKWLIRLTRAAQCELDPR